MAEENREGRTFCEWLCASGEAKFDKFGNVLLNGYDEDVVKAWKDGKNPTEWRYYHVEDRLNNLPGFD